MNQLNSFFKKLAVSAALALCSFTALAGPVYTVTLNTAAFTGTAAKLDLGFGSSGGAAPATATLSNFIGDFSSLYEQAGIVSGSAASTITLANDPLSYVTYSVVLGETFSFKVSFGDSFTGFDHNTFAVALYNEMMDGFIGADGAVFTIDLLPGAAGVAGEVLLTQTDGLATALPGPAEVPEPSQLLLMLTALAMLGLIARRRSRK